MFYVGNFKGNKKQKNVAINAKTRAFHKALIIGTWYQVLYQGLYAKFDSVQSGQIYISKPSKKNSGINVKSLRSK